MQVVMHVRLNFRGVTEQQPFGDVGVIGHDPLQGMGPMNASARNSRCYTEFCDPPKRVTPGDAVAYFL
jgi:hypothetical protein